MSEEVLYIQLEFPDAMPPAKMSADAAGYDLFSYEDAVIPPKTRMLINTGIRMTLPKGTYGRVAPRSGLSVKGIDIGAGVIDRDYTGLIKVLMINHNEIEFKVSKSDRVAQLVIEKIATPPVQVVENIQTTQRGDGGFGSTGV